MHTGGNWVGNTGWGLLGMLGRPPPPSAHTDIHISAHVNQKNLDPSELISHGYG